jgi:hypothetical protein
MKAGLPLLALTAALAACAPAAKAPPVASAPAPVAPPAPARTGFAVSTSSQAAANDAWKDAALTPGKWRYINQDPDTSAAAFDSPEGGLTIECRKNGKSIHFLFENRNTTNNRAITIRTETMAREIVVFDIGTSVQTTIVGLPARDPLLDAIAFTNGRFAAEVAGERTLVLPAWAEVSRVIEDCR